MFWAACLMSFPPKAPNSQTVTCDMCKIHTYSCVTALLGPNKGKPRKAAPQCAGLARQPLVMVERRATQSVSSLQPKLPDIHTMFSMEGSIVTDEACAPSQAPTLTIIQPNLKGPASPRCDSGIGSIPLTDALSPIPSHAKIQFNRLDSGFSDLSSEMNSMQLDPELSPRKVKQLPAAHERQLPTSSSCGPQLNQDSWRELYEADKDGDCQLHLAIASGFTEVVFALIRMAPHPDFLDIQNNELYAPLHIAVLMNQPNMVRRLIVAGATSDIRDLEGNTPLHLASKRGYLECAEALLRSISTEELKEACVNASSSHLTLHKILDTKNYQGEHSVHLATFGQHYNFIRFLCWSGADMNATEGRSGKTCLHYAVNKRDLNLVGLLASKKALGGCEVDLNTQDWCGRTPLLCAVINGDTDIAALLSAQPGCETVAYQESDEDFEFDTDEDIPDVPSYNDIEVNGRIVQSSA